jgi:hypothetical protein
LGTYNTTTKLCDKSPLCSGGTYDPVKKNCVNIGIGGGSGTGGGGVLVGFSGKTPLTLDNLLH